MKGKIQAVTLQDVKDFMKSLPQQDMDMMISAGMGEQMDRLIAESSDDLDELLKEWADDDPFACHSRPKA
jgi:hypothetical protein